MKKTLNLFTLMMLIFTITACSSDEVASIDIETVSQLAAESSDDASESVNTQENIETTTNQISVEYEDEDLDSSVSDANVSYIKLEGDSITFEGSGAAVNGNIVTITSSGVYSISGVLNDGQIVVNTEDEGTVVLVLSGADITCSTSAPIYVSNAEKTVITLADGTENHVTDGASYVFPDTGSDEPNAAVFSKDDLTINGSGSLTVNANYNNGIDSNDDLKITSGSITVNAVNDGIKGRNSIAIKDGTIIINAGGDGMQSNNDEDPEEGIIAIEGGTFYITAVLDGIQAETLMLISGGSITLSSGGGSINSSSQEGWGNWGMGNNSNVDDSAASAKGLKAGVDITITGGTIQIDSSDDSIHSNASITISSGDILLASGDDGIHSDSTLEINGGELRITKSYEGIESALITINDGNVHIVSSDDGINTVGGNDGSSINGRPGQNNFNMVGDYNLYVNGGHIVIDAMGDGMDINGTIDMTGGAVIVNGPTSNGNGPLDYLGTFDITGGFLVAVGSAGMAQAPSTSSTQYSVMHTFQSTQAAGTVVHIESEDGEEILTFVPTKEYQSVVLSSPEIKNGSTYLVFTGGSSSGTVADGLYSDGIYTPGTQVASYTVSSIVTGAGSWGGGFPGNPGGTRPNRP